MASATATFLLRQFFMTLPDELLEAARIDGAGPMRFFWDIVLPLSKTNLAALFVITFIYGWNQYLWPILITSDASMGTAVAGIKSMISTFRRADPVEPGDGGDDPDFIATAGGGASDAALVCARSG